MSKRLFGLVLCLLQLALFAHSAQAAQHPYLLHLPGIGGEMPIDHAMTSGLLDAFPADLEIYDWTCHDRGLNALLAYRRNRDQALFVAKKIEQHYRQHPDQPILLTAHSGGTGIAVWALEALPADVKVDTVLLLASALSPDYDLNIALKHVDKNLYNLYSDGDNAVLGLGTKLFGTIDGVKTEAAGKLGFSHPYPKLIQLPYDNHWMQLRNFGDHIGPMSRPFAKMILSALLLHHPLPELPAPTTQPVTQ